MTPPADPKQPFRPNADLHGNAPDSCSLALLIIDVLNDLEFEGGDQLMRHAIPMAERIRDLKLRARQAGVPVIYLNDNFGKWRSDFNQILEHCLKDSVRGKRLAELLTPDPEDYFVLKPKHSGFYSTTLDTLLSYLGAETLILTGLTGDICIFFTANDAYMRDYRLIVPSDCVASNLKHDNEHALAQMVKLHKADVTPSDHLDLQALLHKSRKGSPHEQRQAS